MPIKDALQKNKSLEARVADLEAQLKATKDKYEAEIARLLEQIRLLEVRATVQE